MAPRRKGRRYVKIDLDDRDIKQINKMLQRKLKKSCMAHGLLSKVHFKGKKATIHASLPAASRKRK